ncbi:MAG: class I SAM-dependent methyltransferase [Bdellovibrionota bacterium]
MESMTEQYEKRWGEGVIDFKDTSLPSLKIGWIADRLPQGPIDLLDYGCGEGKLLKSFARVRPEINFYGIDIQQPKTVSEFQFELKKNETEPLFSSKNFDAIVSVDVLEHVPDIRTCLQHIGRHLKNDGKLYLFVPAEGQFFSFYNFYRLFLGQDLYRKTKDHYKYTRKQILEFIREQYEIEDLNYAYHFFGSLMDATFFAVCAIPKVAKWWWTKNSIYHPNEKKSLPSLALELANSICYWESKILRRSSFGASGLFIKARKKTTL